MTVSLSVKQMLAILGTVVTSAVVLFAAIWALVTWSLSDVRDDVDRLAEVDAATVSDTSEADTEIRDTIHNVDNAVARVEVSLSALEKDIDGLEGQIVSLDLETRDGFTSVYEQLSEVNRVLVEINGKMAAAAPQLDSSIVMMSAGIMVEDWGALMDAVQSADPAADEPIMLWKWVGVNGEETYRTKGIPAGSEWQDVIDQLPFKNTDGSWNGSHD